ncbi:hypothetical protein GEMRC1_003293 [Eukaryota sp. GEM-RC1]
MAWNPLSGYNLSLMFKLLIVLLLLTQALASPLSESLHQYLGRIHEIRSLVSLGLLNDNSMVFEHISNILKEASSVAHREFPDEESLIYFVSHQMSFFSKLRKSMSFLVLIQVTASIAAITSFAKVFAAYIWPPIVKISSWIASVLRLDIMFLALVRELTILVLLAYHHMPFLLHLFLQLSLFQIGFFSTGSLLFSL